MLAFVANRGPLQLKDLIEWEGISATVLSRVIGRLSKDGLIRRMPGTKDKRMAMVAVTSKGSRLHRKTREQSVRLLRAALSEMPRGSSEALAHALPVLEELTYKLLDKDLGRADGRRPRNPERTSDTGDPNRQPEESFRN